MAANKKRATIHDVALHAGVSTAAVSKVLRGAYGSSDAMQQRVRESIAALDYRPLASARGMRGRTYTVGVLVSDLMNPFFGVLIDGISGELSRAGFELLVGVGGLDPASQLNTTNAMVDHQMDGLIMVAPHMLEEQLSAIARVTPLVLVGQHGPATNYDTVAGDDLEGAELIVDHLVGLGHTRIGHVANVHSGPVDSREPGKVRALGYHQAMERRGLEPDAIERVWSREGGIAAAKVFLARPKPPTAIFAGADVVAFGLVSGFWNTKYRVPNELSLVGYDNTPTASLEPVSLTSVDQAGLQIGAQAARLLLERIGGRTESVSTLVRPELIVRTTTAPPRES